VQASEVVDVQGGWWRTTLPNELSIAVLRQGRLVTVPRLVSQPQAKSQLALAHQAAIVDMESAVAARLCSKNSLPFGIIRAVSDDASTSLSPRLVSLLQGGRVSCWRLVASLAKSPRLVPELIRLARHTRLAARNLGDALWSMLGRGGG